MGKRPQPKTTAKRYLIYVEGSLIATADTVALARKALRGLSVPPNTDIILVRENVTQTILKTIRTNSKPILSADSLDFDL